jgi:hypothetical protein
MLHIEIVDPKIRYETGRDQKVTPVKLQTPNHLQNRDGD